MLWFSCLVSVALAIIRIFGVTSIAFQAVAHLWVGGLFAVAVALRWHDVPNTNRLNYWWMACALTVVETIMFLVSR